MKEFWKKKVEWHEAGDPDQVIINGDHYHIRPDNDGPGARGHGGREFIITFHDGRVVTTKNLWNQGLIDCPEARAILQDNAVWGPYPEPEPYDPDEIPF